MNLDLYVAEFDERLGRALNASHMDKAAVARALEKTLRSIVMDAYAQGRAAAAEDAAAVTATLRRELREARDERDAAIRLRWMERGNKGHTEGGTDAGHSNGACANGVQ
jgi:hypothetical protein